MSTDSHHRDVSNGESDLDTCDEWRKADDCIHHKHQYDLIEDFDLVFELCLERPYIAKDYDRSDYLCGHEHYLPDKGLVHDDNCNCQHQSS